MQRFKNNVKVTLRANRIWNPGEPWNRKICFVCSLKKNETWGIGKCKDGRCEKCHLEGGQGSLAAGLWSYNPVPVDSEAAGRGACGKGNQKAQARGIKRLNSKANSTIYLVTRLRTCHRRFMTLSFFRLKREKILLTS